MGVSESRVPIRPGGRFMSWMDRNPTCVDAVLFDIDGVLIRSRQALPGAGDLIAALRQRGVPYVLLTNDGCSSAQEKSRYLAAAGLDIRPEEICSSGHALVGIVRTNCWEGEPFFAMGLILPAIVFCGMILMGGMLWLWRMVGDWVHGGYVEQE